MRNGHLGLRHWGSSPKHRFEPYFGELKPLWGSLGEVIIAL